MPQRTEIQFPYEIESNCGGRWVYRNDDDGDLMIDGVVVERAGWKLHRLLDVIRNGGGFWWHGSCVYAGPLREPKERP